MSKSLQPLLPKLESVDRLLELLLALGLPKDKIAEARRVNNENRVHHIARQLLSKIEYDMFFKFKNGQVDDDAQDDLDHEDHSGFQKWLHSLP